MKKKLLYYMLLAVFTISANAQTFDWETATLNGTSQNPNSYVSQVINGQYFASFSTPNQSPILLTTAGQGTSGLSVINQQLETSVTIGVNESVGTTVSSLNIQSIKVFEGSNNQNWTFKSLDASGNVLNTTTANVSQNASVVTLNWTNVRLIEITRTNGSSSNFGVDDIVFTPTTPAQPIIYVNQNATGNNNGTSWADAFTDLTDAIALANSSNEIWVAQGTYLPTVPTGGNGRNRTFNLPDNAKLYGGFVGTETSISQRDFRANITTLSGDFNNDDTVNLIDTEATRQENAIHVITLKGNVKNIIVDGFTISGGNANGIIVSNCNITPSSQYDNRRGGALYTQPYNSGDIEAEIVNCVFEKNTASDTAVFSSFYPCGEQNISSTINFESCIVRDNYSATNSAFLLNGADGYSQRLNSIINNCLFNNNTSANGASVFYVTTSGGGNPGSNGINVQVINSTFSNNTGLNGNTIRINNNSGTNLQYYMFNSIIWGNGSTTPFLISGNTTQVANTIVEGGQQLGTNNNPLFLNASQNNYSLQGSSPAIDAGNNARVPTGITLDLAGNQRIFNTTVDIGAYEFGGAAPVTRTLTLNATNGSIIANPTPTNGTYADGTVVTLTATPASGYQFDGWSGDVTGTTNSISITMDADKIVTATFSQQCLVTIPDTNFKNYLVGNTAINTNGDTEIQCSEASAFTGTMYADNKSISNLTGIEAFTNITELNCGENQLTSLNITQNTALTMLRCADNQLTSLDISQNTALTELYPQDNQITSLDVSQNTMLQYFYCYNNQLTSLDISQNTMLIALQALNNQLTSLDVSQNTALTQLFLQNNQLTNLNIANGNNTGINNFSTLNNANLTCIQIDAGFTPSANWQKDATASYNTNCGTLSINDFELENISIYPNPVRNTLFIELKETLVSMEIFNVVGKKVLESEISSINVSNLSSGLYFLKVHTKDGKIGVKRFAKK
ncbi:InlB B-repeat-containing protein [Pontimicrobium sp. MEBiC06410]